MFTFLENFEMWKLHTVRDYLLFFLVVVTGAVIFWLITRRINRRRNRQGGVHKVAKRLRKLAVKPFYLFADVTLRMPDGEEERHDLLLLDRNRILLIRVLGWGSKAWGTAESQMWKIEDTKGEKKVENPLPALRQSAADLQQQLGHAEIYGAQVMPLVVFADTFRAIELYLGKDTPAVGIDGLKKWYTGLSAPRDPYDFQRALALIEDRVVPQEEKGAADSKQKA